MKLMAKDIRDREGNMKIEREKGRKDLGLATEESRISCVSADRLKDSRDRRTDKATPFATFQKLNVAKCLPRNSSRGAQ